MKFTNIFTFLYTHVLPGLLFLILLSPISLYSQISFSDTSKADIGSQYKTQISLGNIGQTSEPMLSARIILSNTSIILPQDITVENNESNFINYNFIQEDDSTYYFSVTLDNTQMKNQLILDLNSLALAGNDSSAFIFFEDISLNYSDDYKKNDTTLIISNNPYVNQTYIRKLKAEPIYPNPVEVNQDINVRFQTDVDEKITVTLYNLNCKMIDEIEIENHNKKWHNVIFSLDQNHAAGTYFVTIKSKTSYTLRRFQLAK